jgi:hypothetical protein
MKQLLVCIPSSSKHPIQIPIKVTHSEHVTANTRTDFKQRAQFTASSILEWTKEAGILIASCIYEDHQSRAFVIALTTQELLKTIHETQNYGNTSKISAKD